MPDNSGSERTDNAETAIRPAEPAVVHPPRAGASRFTPGAVLAGRYRIVSLLGKGGMGEVYRGEDLKLGAPVALKFLPATIANDARRVRRFYEEVRIGRQVSHPNVCRIYDVAEVEGLRFLSMEYVDGEDLASLLRRIGRLPFEKALDVSRDLCAGLAAAHDLGIVHRDLKPANVMLDGRGRARITDFGLAALASDLEEGRSLVGTPAYLPPEQLEGGAATARGDLYSLGLVLFELLTGKRPFEGKTAAQIAEQAQEGRLPRVSAVVPEVPASVDRTIARCLDRDPLRRPTSAREVMAALPGGDPLQAAVAAGVTPAPEVVAAAGAVGGLPASTAWSWLGAAAAGIALLGLLANSTRLSRLIPLDKPPVLLEERAREILRGQGYSEPGRYRWRFLVPDELYLRHVARTDSSPRRWEALSQAEPPAVHFTYWESAAPLVSFGPASSFLDPPWTEAGVRGVRLDTRGRLDELVVVPPQWEEPGGERADPNWDSLFQEAGIEIGDFSAAEPRLMPPVGFDRRAAWAGFHPLRHDIPLQVEAAAYRGRAVFFSLIYPWDTRDYRYVGRVSRSGRPPEFRGSAGETLQELAKLTAVMLGIAVAALVARRNWRLGRADRHGAGVVAGFIATTSLLAWLFQSGHVLSINTEGERLASALENALLVATAGWIMYLALEPLARRRAPETLISWSRLLAGRLRDPLVGRHVLVGLVFGLLLQALNGLLILAPTWIGRPALSPHRGGVPVLTAPAFVFQFLFDRGAWAVFSSVGILFLVVLLGRLLRSRGLALAVAGGITAVWGVAGWWAAENLPLSLAFSSLQAASMLFVLHRFGLLALAVSIWIFAWLNYSPFSFDLSSWRGVQSALVLSVLASLALYGFRASLAGRPALGMALLDD